MYIKRESKYFTTLYIADVLCLIVAYLISAVIRFGGVMATPDKYGVLLTLAVLASFCSNAFMKNFRNFFQRGYFHELLATGKSVLCTIFILSCCLLFLRIGANYSRGFLIIFAIVCGVLTYGERIFAKHVIVKNYKRSSEMSRLMVVTTSDRLSEVFANADKNTVWDCVCTHIAVIDKDMIGTEIDGRKIDANVDNFMEIARTDVVDEVLIHAGYHNPELQKLVKNFQSMGVTVRVVLNNLSFDMPNVRVEKFSGFNVLTTSNNMITHRQLVEKRAIDILGSLVGLILTGIISIFVVPAIKLESKGPAVYSQIRVGRNGRKFKIYKFRSMYQDADKRKAELMAQNKMDGLMFKMDDDPRITKVGKFIRKTSIDELPQFWNVFKGDMSLVGTRPPTIDEFEQYELHHKNRLSFKPGITGMWQAMGRSDITDFEEVVKLDTDYIENWSVKLDIKLLFMTVLNVLRKKGAE